MSWLSRALDVAFERRGPTWNAGGLDRSTCDPFEWGDNRTRLFAHKYIAEHFDELPSGAVVDVEFILGESAAPKLSEAVTDP